LEDKKGPEKPAAYESTSRSIRSKKNRGTRILILGEEGWEENKEKYVRSGKKKGLKDKGIQCIALTALKARGGASFREHDGKRNEEKKGNRLPPAFSRGGLARNGLNEVFRATLQKSRWERKTR